MHVHTQQHTPRSRILIGYWPQHTSVQHLQDKGMVSVTMARKMAAKASQTTSMQYDSMLRTPEV